MFTYMKMKYRDVPEIEKDVHICAYIQGQVTLQIYVQLI